MKYYLIAGEASGDLHASRLMESLRQRDPQAQFRCIGGDLMEQAAKDTRAGGRQQGDVLVRHYRHLAYMGVGPVLRHLPTILRNMRMVKHDIGQWQPDAVVLVDYPGFNLAIAKYVHAARESRQLPEAAPRRPKVIYYIAPKIWAWKEHRIKNIRRDVDKLLSILPFEVEFFEGKHHYPISYVGNPTADEVGRFKEKAHIGNDDFLRHNALSAATPIIALLCGSRQQEIRENLPAMLEATRPLAGDCQVVIAGAPGIDHGFYSRFTQGHKVSVLPSGNTYRLLCNAHAALVTSGTATLETALFGVPQVVCYATPMPRLFGLLRKLVLKVKYVSLVNLIAGREVVPELVATDMTVSSIGQHLETVLKGPAREKMLRGYEEVKARLGHGIAPDNAAQIIISAIQGEGRPLSTQ